MKERQLGCKYVNLKTNKKAITKLMLCVGLVAFLVVGLTPGLGIATESDFESNTSEDDTNGVVENVNYNETLNTFNTEHENMLYSKDNEGTFYGELDAAIARAESLDTSLYTEETLIEVQTALAAAKAIAKDLKIDQQPVIDDATTALNEALNKLEPKPNPEPTPTNSNTTENDNMSNIAQTGDVNIYLICI